MRWKLYNKWLGVVRGANWEGKWSQVNVEEQKAVGFGNCSYVKRVTVDRTKIENISFHAILNICGKNEPLHQRVQQNIFPVMVDLSD